MKKIVLGVVAVIAVIVAVCFFIRSSANSKIEAKIEELRSNGFNVTYEKKNVPLKIEATGNIEVAYPEKALNYLISLQNEGDLKKNLEKGLKLFDKKDIDLALEGLSFDYDFKVNLLNKKVDANLYLTKLSNSLMQELLAKDNKASEIFADMLKNRDIQISFDENKNFKIKDINFVDSNNAVTLRGMSGNSKSFDIDLLKIATKTNDATYSFEGIKSFYEERPEEVVDSKFDVAKVEILDNMAEMRLNNVKVSSFSKIISDLYEGDTKLSFDDLNIKQLNGLGGNLEMSLKNSNIDIFLNKFPFKKYEEFLDVYNQKQQDSEKLKESTKEFLDVISKSGIELSLNANSKSLVLNNNEWYKELDFKSKFTLNKNLPSMKFESVDDIFETINFEVKLDKESVEKATKELGLNSNNKIQLIDSEDNKYKLFKIELKEDGLYINNSLVLDKNSLKFTKEETDNSSLTDESLEDDSKVLYSYKMLDKNTLRVNFKYETSLNKVNSGGISVSFPQLKDATLIKAKDSKNFKSLDVYKSGNDIFSGILDKNVKATYLMIEGFDDNWTDTNIAKEFSLDIDVSTLDDVLEINLRGYSSNSDSLYELVPTEKSSETQDQQSYYVKIADIDLAQEKANIK